MLARISKVAIKYGVLMDCLYLWGIRLIQYPPMKDLLSEYLERHGYT
jgi:hypothetical protein